MGPVYDRTDWKYRGDDVRCQQRPDGAATDIEREVFEARIGAPPVPAMGAS